MSDIVFYIEGDSERNYDGRLIAHFKDQNEDNNYTLSFDVNKWESTTKNGLIGGGYLQTWTGKYMQLQFDLEYPLDYDTAREVYTTLVTNGWQE